MGAEVEHGWGEKSYCPSPEKSASQVCKVGRGLAFLHGVLHFLAVVVYILHRKVNDIPEFLQVFLHILHFCQIRRTSPGCCRSASVWLGDAAELGGCAAGLMLAVKASPVLVRGLNTAKPRTLFPVPFPFPLLACMVFSLPVLGCVWLVWLGWYGMGL